MAEVVWAIRYEMARTIDDVLSRRVRPCFRCSCSDSCFRKVSQLLAEELIMMMFGQKTKQPNLKKLANGFFTRISNKIINKSLTNQKKAKMKIN
jgi:glycerol-3-phosphate dehydrogenase